MKFLHNQTLPRWTPRQLRRRGLGGTNSSAAGLGSSQVLNTIPGGYGDAWRTLTGRDYPTWNFQ
jgi:hypothetical protein